MQGYESCVLRFMSFQKQISELETGIPLMHIGNTNFIYSVPTNQICLSLTAGKQNNVHLLFQECILARLHALP